MKFRTGLTYWRAIAGERPPLPPLAGNAQCQVAVIGGGISGVLTAHELVQAGLETILVDRGEVVAESTAASTGLLLYEIDTPLVELIAKVGEAHAVHAYRRGLNAIDELAALDSHLGDASTFERRPCLYFASNQRDAQQLEEEYACQKHFGLPVELLTARELSDRTSIAAPRALWSRGDAQVDPYRFTLGVLDRARAAGLRAFSNTRVVSVDRTAHGPLLRTLRGDIQAESVVYATGYASDEHVGRRLGQRHSTYVVVSEPLTSQSGWPEQCLLWETARPYFYARQTADGRAIIGGEDTPWSDDHRRDELVERQSSRLMERFAQLFPQLTFVPELSWAGTFADTDDGLAYIGRPGDYPHEYFAVGYGGNGITFSLIAARLITDLILGRPNPDAAVFRFGR